MLKNCFIFICFVTLLASCKKDDPTSTICNLPKVTDLLAYGITDNSFFMTWENVDSEVTITERSTNLQVSKTNVDRIVNGVKAFTEIKNLKANTEYTVKVNAICPLNKTVSTISNEIFVKTVAGCDLPKPQNVKTSFDIAGRLTITWDAVPNADQYYIEAYSTDKISYASSGYAVGTTFTSLPIAVGITEWTVSAVCDANIISRNKATFTTDTPEVLSEETAKKVNIACYNTANCDFTNLGKPYAEGKNTGIYPKIGYFFDNLSSCESYYYKVVSDTDSTVYADFIITASKQSGSTKVYYKDGDCTNLKNNFVIVQKGVLKHKLTMDKELRVVFHAQSMTFSIPPGFTLYRK